MKAWMALLLLAPLAPAQSLDGDLVDSVTGAPVAGAHVSVQGENSSERTQVLSDAAGHFHFSLSSLPWGSAMAIRAGYLTQQTPLKMQGQTALANLRMAMVPQAVISGSLEDEDGFAAEGATVAALHYTIVNGRRELQAVHPMAQVNDLGEFRLAQLPAGRYYLCAMAGNLANWDRQYSGECPAGLAKAIEVKAGQELSAGTVRLLRHPGVTVSGRLAVPAGRQLVRAYVSLSSSMPYRFGMNLTAMVQRDGSFAIRHVPPGDYSLQFTSGQNYPPRPGDLYASQEIHVADSDMADRTLTARELQPVTLKGKAIADDGSAPGRMTIGLRPMSGGTLAASTGEDGTFEFPNVMPGHFDLMILSLPLAGAGTRRVWQAVSARLSDRDVLQGGFWVDSENRGPLEITISAKLVRVMGQVVDAAGRPLVNAALLLAGPGGRQLLGTDADGRFFSGAMMPEGDYRVYVVADVEKSAVLEDAEYLAAHAGDLAGVHLAQGENDVVAIRVK